MADGEAIADVREEAKSDPRGAGLSREMECRGAGLIEAIDPRGAVTGDTTVFATATAAITLAASAIASSSVMTAFGEVKETRPEGATVLPLIDKRIALRWS